MTVQEQELYDKIQGIFNYVSPIKERELDYLYDNENELNGLINFALSIGTQNVAILDRLAELKADVDASKTRVPTRSEAEQAFYNHIKGVNSWVFEQKIASPGFLFSNVSEFNGILSQFKSLGSVTDPSIINAMNIMARDIVTSIEITKGYDEAMKFSESVQTHGLHNQFKK